MDRSIIEILKRAIIEFTDRLRRIELELLPEPWTDRIASPAQVLQRSAYRREARVRDQLKRWTDWLEVAYRGKPVEQWVADSAEDIWIEAKRRLEEANADGPSRWQVAVVPTSGKGIKLEFRELARDPVEQCGSL